MYYSDLFNFFIISKGNELIQQFSVSDIFPLEDIFTNNNLSIGNNFSKSKLSASISNSENNLTTATSRVETANAEASNNLN